MHSTEKIMNVHTRGIRSDSVLVCCTSKVAIHDKRLKRPSLPDVKGTADDVMDEEEFK